MSAETTQGFIVTPEELGAAATHIDSRAAEIESGLARLGNYVASLSDEWQGPAHSEFLVLMADYQRDSNQMHSVLSDLSNRLKHSHANYSLMERSNVVNVRAVELPHAQF